MIENKKNSFLKQVITITIITIIIFGSIIFCIEIFKLGSKLQIIFSKKNNDVPLHKTEYYGEILDFNPYRKSDMKYVHPYVAWSLPWKKDDIKHVSNKFLNLNKKGQRANPYLLTENKYTGLLTGGSVAFGYYASSDKTSPAALLSKDTKFNIYNLNGPSWNSYQELIALLNFDKKYDFVVSYSASNDLSAFCGYTAKNELIENYPDAIERFFELSNHVNKIQSTIYDLDFKTVIKYSLVKTIPETLKILFTIRNNLKTNKNTNKKRIKAVNKNECINDNLLNKEKIKIIVDKFLDNQNKIRKIAEINNAEHFLILQALFFNQEDDSNTLLVNNKLLRYYYDEILSSNFCKKNCYDFHDLFSKINNVNSYQNNNSGVYKNEIFIDNAHLSYVGNNILAENILKIINQKFK